MIGHEFVDGVCTACKVNEADDAFYGPFLCTGHSQTRYISDHSAVLHSKLVSAGAEKLLSLPDDYSNYTATEVSEAVISATYNIAALHTMKRLLDSAMEIAYKHAESRNVSEAQLFTDRAEWLGGYVKAFEKALREKEQG